MVRFIKLIFMRTKSFIMLAERNKKRVMLLNLVQKSTSGEIFSIEFQFQEKSG